MIATPSTHSTFGISLPSGSYSGGWPNVSYKPNANETTAATDNNINTLSCKASQANSKKDFGFFSGN